MAIPSTGHFTWHELMTSDLDAATKFYTSVFGWTHDDMPAGPMGTYRLFKQGEVGIGGAMKAPPGVPSHWFPYVGVEDTDASAKKITELHGKLVVPPTTVPDMLRFAIAMDPTGGAAFGIMTPIGPAASMPPYDGAPRIGTFCWDELHTRDLEAAKKFYTALFGWGGKGDKGDMPYWHWSTGSKDIGGMTTHMGPANAPAHWLGYIAVSDVDAMTKKAESLGGKVVMPAMEIPKVGKFSVVQDPTGAVFSPFRSARV